MHALDGGGVHPDLERGRGRGQVGDLLRIELDGQGWTGILLTGPRQPVVCAQGGVDQGEERAQDAVRVQAGHLVQGREYVGPQRLDHLGARGCVRGAQGRVEARLEQPDQGAGELRVGVDHLFQVFLAEGGAGLP